MAGLTVTATQGGATTGGTALVVRVVTSAKVPASQTGAAVGAQSSTPNLSITPNATGSLLYTVGLTTNAAGPTAEPGVTLITSLGATGLDFNFYKSTSTTTSGTPVLMGSSTGTGIAISVAEILASSGSVSEWTSQPGAITSGTTVATTGNFSPPPNSLLVAMASSNGGAGTTTMTITDTWGLTWTNLQQENGGSHGYTGIWIAQVPDPTPTLVFVSDAALSSTPTNFQSVNYTPQSSKSFILCCASIYSSNNSVTGYTSITDNVGNTWRYATTSNQLPPYTFQSISGQFYNTIIGWTWQDAGAATNYHLNFSGSAFVNMSISEWSGVGSVNSAAAAASTAGAASLAGPTAALVTGSVGVGLINTLSGSLTGTVTGSDGINAISMPHDSTSNFVVYSTNSVAGQSSPYGFTWPNFGSGHDYASNIIILAPTGAATGSFFALVDNGGGP